MTAIRKEKIMELIPSEKEIALARDSSRSLAQTLPKGGSQVKIRVISERDSGADIDIPISALRLLVDLLTQMAQGNAVTLLPLHAELTTQQAADLLNVSRPFFVGLLNEDKIPFRKVGRHRRVSARDVIEFKVAQEKKSDSAVDVLVSEAQKLRLGYE
ncbi:MAG: helix-turn-helix domain-containing protein [Bdellovibrionales bacterium]|nr:helix-turn-helix domain-containing protein [Bdellovibrionales bacterium]